MQKLLKLRHHRHTGRKLAHHHTSYRGLAAVLLACGLAMLMIQKASADNYVVSARVPVEIPTTASQITNPPSGGTYTNSNIHISGTCQVVTPATIVQLWDNGYLLGSSACAVAGSFDIPVTLLAGANNVTPRTSTIQNDYGPDGAVWTATYNPPVIPPPPGSGGNGNSSSGTDTGSNTDNGTASGPGLSVSDAFLIYRPFQLVTLVVIIAPSDSPYKLTTDWGDGTVEQTTFNQAGRHELEHIYKTTGTFRLNLRLVDAKGKVTQFVLAAVYLGKSNFVSNIKSIPSISSVYKLSLAWIIWLSYFIAIVITFFLWLVWRRRDRQPATQPVSYRSIGAAQRPKRL